MREEEPDEILEAYSAYDDVENRRRPRPRREKRNVALELAEAPDNAIDREMSYQPSRFEGGWLLESLQSFYQQNLIVDVQAHVKGGKEASVYRCEAHPATGCDLLAAKVYRPRRLRNLRNDKMYREGRPILTDDGRVAKRTDHRLMRALDKKTDFGVQVQHTSWLLYEFTTLRKLYEAGAAVPCPIAAADNAILMSYVGDALTNAPTLSEVTLPPAEANLLFTETLRNIQLMLQHGQIHGDLSAYNLLYWEGRITLIDFPQVTDCHANPHAEMILRRDVTRVCDYFLRAGVDCDPEALADDLWERYGPESEEPLGIDA